MFVGQRLKIILTGLTTSVVSPLAPFCRSFLHDANKTKKNPQQFPAGGFLEIFQSFEIRSYAERER
jgi:hypothetical protein